MASNTDRIPGRRARLRVLVAAILALFAFVGATQPASAASVVLKKVGSQTSIWTTTNYMTPRDDKVTVSVIPTFTSHTSTSVKLTTFRICFSTTFDPEHVAVSISPVITDNGTGWTDDWVYRTYYSGDCRTYTVNRTFRNNSTDHMFRIEPRITHSLIGGSTTAAYER
ncbi:hypothetical protein ACFQHV_09350 [Promicromonospora thailandica]|uniref:Uncharacterized protein n=1 Tax=Promicromonospora thailandica TaxID=765201 RepID=A0A9X2G630_9MICO|nr:hypothetical protein [Promicromonospora thailandica]MCP2266233.1 hypothetical protein [Promicromonospora thailandica]BFF20723.1 hypothetical protein GCM10025730_42440 [Promicromonospora thailandica]